MSEHVAVPSSKQEQPIGYSCNVDDECRYPAEPHTDDVFIGTMRGHWPEYSEWWDDYEKEYCENDPHEELREAIGEAVHDAGYKALWDVSVDPDSRHITASIPTRLVACVDGVEKYSTTELRFHVSKKRISKAIIRTSYLERR